MESTNAMHLGKRFIVCALAIGLMLAGVVLGWRNLPSSQESSSTGDSANQYPGPSTALPTSEPATSPSQSIQAAAIEPSAAPAMTDQPVEWNFTDDQKREVRAWARSRGSVTIGSDPEYYSYNREILRALAENSQDVKAMSVLAQMSVPVERLKWYRLAAVYGSSDALAGAALAAFANDSGAPEALKRAQLIESLAYLKVAELRNDFLAGRGVDIDELQNQAGVRLTQEDKAAAEQMAQPLYDELEAQRIQLGLGKFDNSVPPVVEAYYRMYNLN